MIDFGITEYDLNTLPEFLEQVSHARYDTRTGCITFYCGDVELDRVCDGPIWSLCDYFAYRHKANPEHPDRVSYEQYQRFKLKNQRRTGVSCFVSPIIVEHPIIAAIKALFYRMARWWINRLIRSRI